MNSLELCQVTKTWGDTTAVDNVSFRVNEGCLTVLLGPSGCGKSTLLRLIAGLESVCSGAIRIGGEDVTWRPPSRRGVSMVFQNYALFPHLPVRENILFGLKVRKVAKAERLSRLTEAARMVGLGNMLERRPSELSGGQRQRVALARSIVSRRPICLMDEPLSNLDAKLRAEMREEIRALQQKLGLTMIYVTHDQVEAMTMADDVVLLKDGRVEQKAPPGRLYTHPETLFAARFIGSPPMNLLRPDELAEIRSADTAESRCADYAFLSAIDASLSYIGVRPEQVAITDRGLAATVVTADYLGAETIVKMTIGRQFLFARFNGVRAFMPGERLHISWPREAVHRFDEKGFRQKGHELKS